MPNHVFLTGVTGFIAKRIALDLLNGGHTVTGSLRNPARADEVRDALHPHLTDPGSLEHLTFATLDLTRDEGWTDAMAGCDTLMHTASPFPLSSPKDENDLIRPAVDGTLRALNAAKDAGVTRVILTSSVVAIEANDRPNPQTPANWTDVNHPRATPYYTSKTLAERAAWDFVAEHPEMQLTTINPSLVLGAPLDDNYGTSLSLIERMMAGKDPALPPLGFGLVDVEDVSAMHIAAMARPESAGNRYIASAGSMMMPAIGAHLKGIYPDRKIATRQAPGWLLRVLALFDPSIRTILPQLGHMPEFDTSVSIRDLGITFTPATTALKRAADAVT
ncbi:NAD-dependent epimerase/dehydratase family protein [Jannaschia sp. CCS1]|uniref:NAD-dependent epimerase/dehydratase family protein n=1 Tax=Jannaschia sp. (strain CCS1) TaxID=290400 RepID=UPI000053CF9A|nr:NAD-dependent epimerase/dehydratase family protein [Jannaschia sp. CCS1]ABD53446.1 Dihydrokaempferol 4-reductase [Jannaschia sp. CCS1]